MTSLDEQLVDSIVAGVLDRLRGTSAPPFPASETRPPATSPTDRQPRESTQQPEPLSLTDRVITEAVLELKLNGVKAVRFSPKSVLTPTARDYLRVHRIEWSIASETSARTAKTLAANWAALVVHATSSVDRVLADLMPGTRRELLGCPDDAAAWVIAELSRGGIGSAIVFAHQTHRTACLANRHTAVKAVAVRDAGDVNSIRRQLRANVWCLDPSGRTYFELRNILKAILAA